MSGFTTFNAAGFGASGVTGNVLLNYDPIFTSSVPIQNIPSGTTATSYIPGSYNFNGSTVLLVTNPQIPNAALRFPFSEEQRSRITALNGAGDFTVECWWYPTVLNITTAKGLINGTTTNNLTDLWSLVVDGGGQVGSLGWWRNNDYAALAPANTIKINSWQHVAYSRQGTTGRLFVNGVQVASGTDNFTYRTDLTQLQMSNFPGDGRATGFMSQPRITLSAVYTADFTPSPVLGVLPLTTFYAPAPSAASMGSDFSPSGQTISPEIGTMTYSSFAPAASTGSGIVMTDTTSNIITANSSALTFGTGNFTVEYWVNTPYTTSTSHQFTMLGNSAGMQIIDFANQPVAFTGWALNNAAGAIINQAAFVAGPNSWNHIAYGKSGANMTLWVNGRQQASSVYNTPVNTTWFGINRFNTPAANVAYGPIRVSNSAVYTTGTNFSPPSTFSNTANTVLLLQPAANTSAYLVDRSVNAIPVSSFGNVVSSINRVDYNISGNVIGDISGSRNNGVILKRSGQGTVIGATFNNNYGGHWQFTGTGGNAVIQQTGPAISSAGNVSLSTWFQTTTANTALASFNNSQYPTPTAPNTINISYFGSNGSAQFYTFTSSAQNLATTGNVCDGNWHHYVSTYNTSSGAVSIYIDGQVRGSTTFSGAPFAMSGWYQLGWSGSGDFGAFNGNLGPTAIYQSSLTAAQVQSIYASQVGRFPPPAVGATGSLTLASTGTVRQFVVPAGVTSIRVNAVGGAGGQSTGASSSIGGAGANITANISVAPGQILYAVVGRGGLFTQSVNGTVAEGGGGAGGFSAGAPTSNVGGGGGFTGLFTSDPSTQPSNAQGAVTALLVAGGGGGTGGAGGANWVNGGNAAVSLTGNAQPGGSGWYGANNIKIQGFSSTGTTAVVTLLSAIGNTTYVNAGGTQYSVGSPVGFSGVAGVTPANIYRVTGGNATAYTIESTLGFNLPTGNLSLSTAFGYQGNSVLYNNGTQGDIDLGGGGAWYSGGVAQPGWSGGPIDNQSTVAATIWGSSGGFLQGAQGGGSTATIGYGSGGGGGGYQGGGSGAGYTGGGGGGGNYGDPIRVSNVSLGTMTPTTAVNANGANGTMTINWTTSVAASSSFVYTTGTVQTFTVPPFVTRINTRVVGAGGAASNAAVGGAGANIFATLTVTPGQTLFVVAGLGGRVTSNATGNIATGNLTQGGGGGSWRPIGLIPGATGGGFSGVFTQNPVDVATAQQSAVLVAGGGGAAAWTRGAAANVAYFGGNAATTISGNASPGSLSLAVVDQNYLQGVDNVVVTSAIAATINLNTSVTNKINYIVGMPVSVAGGTFPTSPYFVTGVTASTVTITTGPNPLPAVATYTGTRMFPGGFNGTAVAAFNQAGGGGTPSNGGYGSSQFDGGTNPSYPVPGGGSQFAGGVGGYNVAVDTWNQGSGGGGGWFGGGGAAGAGDVAPGAGGGSNYANSLMVTNLSYGTMTATAANATAPNGVVTFSW